MIREVPGAQLTMNNDEEDQNDRDEDRATHRKWVEKVCQGVQKVLQCPRGMMVFRANPDAVKDLQKCMELLQSEDPLLFDWDVSLYMNVAPAPERSRQRLIAVDQFESDGSDDEECDEEAPGRVWLIGTTCFISTDPPPFWKIIRWEINRNKKFSFSRVKGAAKLSDGMFWKYPVRTMVPTGDDHWHLPWEEDGPVIEIFAKVCLLCCGGSSF